MSRFIGNVGVEEYQLEGAMARLDRLQQLQTRIRNAPSKQYVIFNAPSTRIALEEVGVDYEQIALESITLGIAAAIAAAIAAVIALVGKIIKMIRGVGGGSGSGGGYSVPSDGTKIKAHLIGNIATTLPEKEMLRLTGPLDSIVRETERDSIPAGEIPNIQVWATPVERDGMQLFHSAPPGNGAVKKPLLDVVCMSVGSDTIKAMRYAYTATEHHYFTLAVKQSIELVTQMAKTMLTMEAEIGDDEDDNVGKAHADIEKITAAAGEVRAAEMRIHELADGVDIAKFIDGRFLEKAAADAKSNLDTIQGQLKLENLAKSCDDMIAAARELEGNMADLSQEESAQQQWKVRLLQSTVKMMMQVLTTAMRARGSVRKSCGWLWKQQLVALTPSSAISTIR